METFATRKEIRRRMCSRLGFTTNDTQAPINLEQHNEFIRAAAAHVMTKCPWQNTMRETRVSVGIDQRFINYPTSTTSSNILGLAYWDTDRKVYVPLLRSRIPVELDDEPVYEAGGDESAQRRNYPQLYEPKAQIEIWPRPDQAYEIKIEHTISPDLATEDDVSVVDAELIILWAAADAYEFQGDGGLAAVQRANFDARLMALCRNQGTLPTITRSSLRHTVRSQRDGYIPDSGAWPSQVPT